MRKRGKKAALEISMTTIIVIVLSVVFLILGLGLLRAIYKSATESVSAIDTKLKDQLINIFADENQPIFIKPDDGQIRVRADTTNFGFVIGGKTKNGIDIKNWPDMQYRLVLDKTSKCYTMLGEAKVKSWFAGGIKIASSDVDTATYNPINWGYDGDTGLARIQLDIPKGTPLCTQLVKFDFVDKTSPTDTLPIGGGSFNIEILRKAIV